MRVLVIDDDSGLAQAMRTVLKTYSVRLSAAETPEQGLHMLATRDFDLLLLDVMLPEINGFEICRRIRSTPSPYQHIPIIMLTARSDLTDLVVGLETGADDYITKPFEPRELVARIHAVGRRFRDRPSEDADAGNGDLTCFRLDDASLAIDIANARVQVEGQTLPLTSMEYELLVFLAAQAGQVFTRDDLIESLQVISPLSVRSIDALVYRLRTKMRSVDSRADFIRTIRGRGYSLIGQRVGAAPRLEEASG
ncbi:response regulator transcription factor [Marinivivus vitaminiproducens]|uniref:response regulator transcription factor n=1 Tax=Marinivivus vitaminiproducens TaxID=3035935 RepID=UPI00279A1EA1|nr:response regulator transcription factor [Geminicoccaceae bacterium SCSIO 64248]